MRGERWRDLAAAATTAGYASRRPFHWWCPAAG